MSDGAREADRAESGAAAEAGTGEYAGRPRDPQLEYKAILANASIGIAFTRDRRFTLCNPKFAEMFGWKAEELIGQPGDVVYTSPASYEALGAIAVPMLASGRQLDIEWEVRRRDGATFLARMIAKGVSPTDPRKGTVWIVEDITLRKRHADEVSQLLREQEAILDTASIGIAFVRDRLIVRCNRRLEEMFGYGPGELNGRPTQATYADEAEHIAMDAAYAELSRGQTIVRVMQGRRRDGTVFWERATGRAVDPAHPVRGSVWLVEDITDQRRAEEVLQRVVREQELILDNATVGIVFVRNRVIRRCNRFLETMLGAAPGSLVGRSTGILYASEAAWEEASRIAYDRSEPGAILDNEWQFRRADGSVLIARTRGRRIDAGGDEKEWIWSIEDVTAEREAEARMQRTLAEQELILANATIGIAFARHRRVQRCNPRFEEMFGYGPGELIDQTSAALFASQDEYERGGARMYAHLATGEAYVVERELRRRDGSTFWCKVIARAIDPANPEEGAIAIYEDITAERALLASLEASRDAAVASRDVAEASREALERAVAERTAELRAANERLQAEITDRRQAETRAQHLADHDVLTGLPNRRLLEDRLTQALAASQRNRRQTAVMFVDLDRFKHINDSLGHAAGDRVLKEVAERLGKQLREVDTICRMGGDEFLVVLPEIRRAADAAGVAAKILESIGQPFMVEDREISITPSVGISVYPEDGRDAESLIRNADAAMYHAKETGRANCQFFTEQMNQAASRRLALEGDLRQAVLKCELSAHFQPIVDAGSGAVVACEALLGWLHPTRGLVEAGEFIQLADDTGLIRRMGEWLLGEACRWARSLDAAGAVVVGVNLSARQFHDPKLAEVVARVLAETGLPAGRLELEVPEHAVMQNMDHALAVLQRLRKLGVAVAIDAFGATYSSLVGLRQLPVGKLKIDRSLVAEVQKEGRPIIAGIVGLAHALGLKVVAVGVESDAQREALKDCGCDYLQGYFTGRPVEGPAAVPPAAA